MANGNIIFDFDNIEILELGSDKDARLKKLLLYMYKRCNFTCGYHKLTYKFEYQDKAQYLTDLNYVRRLMGMNKITNLRNDE